MSVITLNNKNFREVMTGDKTIIVDFYATWCRPCKMLSPIIEEVAEEMNDIVFAKCDIDECMIIAKELNIMSVPTMIAFKNGNEVQRFVGFRAKDELIKLFNEVK